MPREQVRGAAVFSSSVVEPPSDENLITGYGDRMAKFVIEGRRRVEEGVQEVTGGRVEQVCGTAVFGFGVVGP